MAALVEILQNLQSNDNAIRSSAEKRYEDARTQEPAATLSALFEVLGQKQLEDPVREQAAVFVRQMLSRVTEEDSTWRKLGEAAQAQTKVQLLQLFENETQDKVRRKMADIIQSLGHQLTEMMEASARPQNVKEWPEMLPMLMRLIMDTSRHANLRKDALWAVQELLVSIWQVMLTNGQQTTQVIQACIADPDLGVMEQAVCFFWELLSNIEGKGENKVFAPIVEPFCLALKKLAESTDSQHILVVLKAMSMPRDTYVAFDFFKTCMATHIMPLFHPLAKGHTDKGTRALALEVIVSFAEAKPKAMSKVPNYIQQTVDVCVSFLIQLDDDNTEWLEAVDGSQDDDDDRSNFDNGKECIDRLCRCMQQADRVGDTLEVVKQALATLVGAGQWKGVVAALTMISQIAEYVDDDDVAKQMAGAVQAQLRAQHPRVRFAAWSAIAQLSEDHTELMSGEDHASALLVEFLHGLDEQCQRVLERCMSSFVHFGENIERELLEPHAQPMMEKLGRLLQSPLLLVQKRVITFIAVIARQVDDAFAPYYGPLMPVLKASVLSVVHKTEERELLGKLFECISLLAKAVGAEVFRQDAQDIMQVMIQATQVPNLPANDPVKEYMMAASQRICSCMKSGFLPFVPHVLPFTLEKLNLDAKELDDEAAADENVELSLVRGEDGTFKLVVMSTSELEDLQNALETIHCFIEELGKDFGPFVAQTAHGLLPVFDFSIGEDIRELAFETWAELCDCARKGAQDEPLIQLVNKFLELVLPKMFDSEEKRFDLDATKSRANGVACCLKKAGPNILNGSKVQHLVEVSMRVLMESLRRREEAKKAPATQADDEDEDAADGTADEELSLRTGCSEVFGALMQHHPDLFMAASFQPVLDLVMRLLTQSNEPDDKKLANYIVCDMLEHLQGRVVSHWPQFMPQLLGNIDNTNQELRQSACYGASLAAKDPSFALVAEETAKKLASLIQSARSKAKKKSEKLAQACADNALSALIAILEHHKAAVASIEAQLWSVWLDNLPCREDEEEGKKNHRTLLLALQCEKAEVVGDADKLTQSLKVLIDVYKSDMADDETSIGIGKAIAKLGQQRLLEFAPRLQDKQKKKLERIYREASST